MTTAYMCNKAHRASHQVEGNMLDQMSYMVTRLERTLPVETNVSLDWETYQQHSHSPGFCTLQLQVHDATPGATPQKVLQALKWSFDSVIGDLLAERLSE